jgi:hypothetical protein
MLFCRCTVCMFDMIHAEVFSAHQCEHFMRFGLAVGDELGLSPVGKLGDWLGPKLGKALGEPIVDALGLSLGELLGLALGEDLSLGEEMGDLLGL